jgi:hypothetical protein
MCSMYPAWCVVCARAQSSTGGYYPTPGGGGCQYHNVVTREHENMCSLCSD